MSDVSVARGSDSRMPALVAVLCVILSAAGPAIFVQAWFAHWNYDEFWSRGLAITATLFALVFLILLYAFSCLAANLRDATVSRMMTRHVTVFAPFLLLAIQPLLMLQYQDMTIEIQFLAIFAAVLLAMVLFMIHEDWKERDRARSGRVLSANVVFALVAALVVGAAALKVHDRYFMRAVTANMPYASSGNTTMRARYAKVPGRFEWKTHVPSDATFEVSVFPQTDPSAAGAPLPYEVRLKPPSGPSFVIAEGIPGASETSPIRYDLSAYAGETVSFEFSVRGGSPAAAILDSFHIILGGLHRLYRMRAWTPSKLLQAYWSEPLVYARRKPSDTNVLFIVFDTLRADHVGCMGYEWNTTPTIDRLAQDGVLFTQTISQAPWTLPSFASIYTGRLPSSHLAGSMQEGLPSVSKFALQPNFVELLRERGYYTMGLVNNPYLTPDFEMQQGFTEYRKYSGNAEKVSDLANAWLESNAGKKFFLLVHYMDPHQPYLMMEDFDPAPRTNAEDESQERISGARASESTVPNRWAAVRSYDSEIAFADYHMGRIINKLNELGLLDRTLVVFVSDHGEEFLDHGKSFLFGLAGHDHGHCLYDELLHVPLIMSYPAGVPRGREVSAQVRLVDIFPTIMDILGIGFDEDAASGRSLSPLMTESTSESRAAVSEFLLYRTEQKSIRTEDYKLIYTPATNRTELYNVAIDPGETRDLSAEEPAICAELMDRLSAELRQSSTRSFAEAKAPTLDDETRESLRALGYVK